MWPRELCFFSDHQVLVLASDRRVLDRWLKGSQTERTLFPNPAWVYGLAMARLDVLADRAWPVLQWAWQLAEHSGWLEKKFPAGT